MADLANVAAVRVCAIAQDLGGETDAFNDPKDERVGLDALWFQAGDPHREDVCRFGHCQGFRDEASLSDARIPEKKDGTAARGRG
jgi:hypothetical protein